MIFGFSAGLLGFVEPIYHPCNYSIVYLIHEWLILWIFGWLLNQLLQDFLVGGDDPT